MPKSPEELRRQREIRANVRKHREGMKKNTKRTLSVRSLLSPPELKFCQLYTASSGRDSHRLYRQAFGAQTDSPDKVKARLGALLNNDLIVSYIEELQLPTKDVARLVLAEQIHTETNPDIARRAAQQILNDDDTELFVNVVDRFWATTAELGAEIEIQLPGRCQSERLVRCKCGEEILVACGAPHGVRAPIADFFPPRNPEAA